MAWFLLLRVASGAESTLVFDGEVPGDGLDHFFLPFEVPAGTVEIEVRHDDLSEADILDWGLNGPDGGWRGWGGGTTLPTVVNAGAATPGYVPGPIDPGSWSVVCGKAKIVTPPGAYHVEVVLRDAITLAAQDRRPFVDPGALATGERWYAGDVHVHSAESTDADATLDEIGTLARERGLDWVIVTDHNTITGRDFLTAAQERHPDLLLIPGTEFTTYAGHAGAYGASAWVDHKIGQPGVTIEAAVAAYAAQGAVLGINHPALDLGDLCIGCAWEHEIPTEGVGAIEIATGGWLPAGHLFTPLALDLWDALGDDGLRLAPLGGSDDHRAGRDLGAFGSPIGNPTTLVWADELSITAILDGIRARRTVVKLQEPADPMAELDARGGSVVVTGAVGGDLVWVEDGVEVERRGVSADPETFTRDVGGARVRAEVWLAGDPRTVTAEVWPDEVAGPTAGRANGPDGGCGCRTTGGAAWAPLAALAWWRRRRTVGPATR